MSPSDAEPGIESVAVAGDHLAARTPGHLAGIAAGEAGIGGGTLGRSFQARHQRASDGIRADAARLPREFQETGAGGRAAVAAYRAADATAAHEYTR